LRFLATVERRHVIQDLIFLAAAANLQHLCLFCGMPYSPQANFAPHPYTLLLPNTLRSCSLSSCAAITIALIFVMV
jgi:hypothetical protein